MNIPELAKEISETISGGIIVVDGFNGQLSQASKIKLDDLLIELVETLRQEILDAVWREYIK